MKIEDPRFNFELIKRLLHIPAEYPSRVQIEITNRCNLDCAMCPRKDFGLPDENMSFSFFKEIMAKLKKVNLILPVGWGESFVHPDIDKIINYLKEHGHAIKITTNGLLLNSQKLRALALNINYLSFSLDSVEGLSQSQGHNNSQIIENIRALIQERGSRKEPFICLQSVLLKNKKDLDRTIELAEELKVDRVNLIRPYAKFNREIAPDRKERARLYEQADKLSRKCGVRVDMFEYASFTGIKRYLWKNFKAIFRVNSWCPRLYDFVYVTIDGKVTPCCALPRYIVGDLTKQSIEEIWQSRLMQQFRKKHTDICKDCDVFRIG